MSPDFSPPSPSRTGTAVRLSLFYVAFFGMLGIHMPFWPVWLKSHGLTPEDIGMVMALATGGRIIAAPQFAQLADRLGERRRPMIGLALFGTVAFLLFGPSHGFWPILGVTLLFTVAWSPLLPLGEILVATTARDTGLQYGRVRLWGSLSFIAAAVGIGKILVGRPADTIFLVMVIAVAATAVSCFLLPDRRFEPALTTRPKFREFLRDKVFVLFLVSGALIQASHGIYYAFSSLHWKDKVGYSEAIIGGLWAEGVIAEVILFAFGAAISRRLQPPTLILLGGLAGLLRWTTMGLTDSLPVLVLIQALHAFTFGTVHLGAVNLIMQRIPAGAAATAMSLYSSVTLGLATGITMLVAGYLYGNFGSYSYFAMTVLAALGTAFALVLMRRWSAPEQ